MIGDWGLVIGGSELLFPVFLKVEIGSFLKVYDMAQEKLYYSIREVADMFDINQSNLRFWEKEFKQLKPKRNDKGTRFYTKKDIQVVKQILFLINNQKLTLEGVKMRLNDKKDVVEKQQELAERLTNIRNELKGLIKQLGG